MFSRKFSKNHDAKIFKTSPYLAERGKNTNSLSPKNYIFRQINSLATSSLVKRCFHEIFAKKVRERVNFCNFHTVKT